MGWGRERERGVHDRETENREDRHREKRLERQRKEKIDTERREISGGQESPGLGKPTGRTGTYFVERKRQVGRTIER